jgi:ABC-2 type transport system ATP-binding protein
MHSVPAIQLNRLTRYFGKHRGIENVSFSVQSGEIFGFLGPNGAGKTVTIRHIMGLLRPTRGTASVLGMDCWAQSADVKAKLGYMPGDARMYEQMTGEQFLEFFAGFRDRRHTTRQGALVERLEVDVSRRIKHLSRGNRQKLLIVQALMHDAPVLILDEPSSGLDPLKQLDFLELLREERDRGKTIMLSSHQLNEVERIADRVAIIRGGHLVAVEDVEDLSRLRERRMTVSLSESADIDGLLGIEGVQLIEQTLDGRHLELSIRADIRAVLSVLSILPVSDLVFGPPELESVFMHYYGKEALAEDELTNMPESN